MVYSWTSLRVVSDCSDCYGQSGIGILEGYRGFTTIRGFWTIPSLGVDDSGRFWRIPMNLADYKLGHRRFWSILDDSNGIHAESPVLENSSLAIDDSGRR